MLPIKSPDILQELLPSGPNWDEQHLSTTLLPEFHGSAGDTHAQGAFPARQTTTSSEAPSEWRVIPLAREHLHTNLPPSFQETRFVGPNGSFEYPLLSQQNGTANSQFLSRSYAFHEQLQSSQIEPSCLESDFNTTLTSFHTSTSFNTTSFSSASAFSEIASPTPPPNHVPTRLPAALTNLKDLPSVADVLRRPNELPKFMRNVVGGVIQNSPARRVEIRSQNRSMDIIEVLVGDETATGFSITFWLPPASSAPQQGKWKGARAVQLEELRTQLEALRPGDIICVTNVALHVYMSKVFGQSVNRSIARTVVSLLPRESSVDILQNAKVTRVRDWVAHFVGRAGSVKEEGKKGVKEEGRLWRNEMPPDTPNSP